MFRLSPERPVGVNHREEGEGFSGKKDSMSNHLKRREHGRPGVNPTTLQCGGANCSSRKKWVEGAGAGPCKA